MGDIVRSRTYEAFFPLIAVTVIYFVLEALFGFLVGRLRAALDPKRRTPGRILRRVDTRLPYPPARRKGPLTCECTGDGVYFQGGLLPGLPPPGRGQAPAGPGVGPYRARQDPTEN